MLGVASGHGPRADVRQRRTVLAAQLEGTQALAAYFTEFGIMYSVRPTILPRVRTTETKPKPTTNPNPNRNPTYPTNPTE